MTQPPSHVRTSAAQPMVTVGMPVYNEARHIDEAIAAVLAQTFESFELVISDNASTDGTSEICRVWAARDTRVRYERASKNMGANTNFNRVVELARGKYFIWVSGHDLRHASYLGACVNELERDASLVLCYPVAAWLDGKEVSNRRCGGTVDTRGLSQISRFRRTLWEPGGYPLYGVIRSSDLRRTRVVRNVIGSDLLLLAELSLLGGMACLRQPLLYVRQLPDHGDWARWAEKALADKAGRSAWNLYVEWAREYWRVVDAHVQSLPRRLVLKSLTLYCLLTKYLFILRGLRQRPARATA